MNIKLSNYNFLKLISLFFVILISLEGQGQTRGIKGLITDENKIPLEMVSVALLNPKDASFLSYTTSDLKGFFHLSDIPKDTILIQLNLLGFKPYSKKLIYKKELLDLKTIVLKGRNRFFR